MTFKQVCVVNNNQIIVTLPIDFNKSKKVTVTVEDQMSTKIQKLKLLKKATTDPLFLADMQEIHLDFDPIDSETI